MTWKPSKKLVINCLLILVFVSLMMAKSGYITGMAQQPTNSALNASTPIAATQALPDRSQPDPTGSSIGSANVPANVTGQPTLTELANAVGHNIVAINFVWTLMAGFLVFFMQAGFALVETGFTRSKNVAHTMGHEHIDLRAWRARVVFLRFRHHVRRIEVAWYLGRVYRNLAAR